MMARKGFKPIDGQPIVMGDAETRIFDGFALTGLAPRFWSTIMLETLGPQLETATRNVFSTMLNWQVEKRDGSDARADSLKLQGVNGSIGVAGMLTGTLFLSIEEELAKAMASTLIGEEAGEDAAQVTDVVGELTNMLAGNCKSFLCDRGCPVVISIPTVIRGRALRAVGRDVQFILDRRFAVPAWPGSINVVLLGKLN